MAFKIEVDREKCIGCAACTAICPKGFEMRGGKSYPKRAKVERLSCEKDAEAGCPVQAIKVSKG